MSTSTASATETFNNYPISSSSRDPGKMTAASGSLWYVESTSSTPDDYIGKMTTSGTTTDYNISYPSTTTGFKIAYLTTGPDGNVWFDGCTTSNAMYAGSLNISTGAVTFYQNTTLPSCYGVSTLGPIAAGSDGNVWYAVVDYPTDNKAYLAKINLSTGTTTTGATFATYTNLTGLTTGPDGNLWATDQYLNRIYGVAVSGSGGGTYSIPTSSSGASDIVAGPDGNLWFIEGGAHKIGKLTTSGIFTEYTLATGVYPGALVAGPDGAVWFTDGAGTPKIGRITSSGSITEYPVPNSDGTMHTPQGIALGSDNAIWFDYSFTSSGGVVTYNLGSVTTAPFFNNYPISSSSRDPGKMTAASGSLWYVEATTSNPGVYDHIGKMTTSGTTTDYNISYPSGTGITKFQIAYVTTGPDGNVWFDGCTNTNAMYAGSLDVSTGAITFYQNTSLPSCYGISTVGPITTGSDGNVWYAVVDYPTDNKAYLSKVNPTSGTTTTGATFTTYTNITGLASGPDGRLWATDAYYNQIYALAISGGTGATYFAGPGSAPTAITAGPDGNMWFLEENAAHKITKVTPSGTFTEYTPATGVYPNQLIAGSDDAVWFTDQNSSVPKISRITSSGGITEYTVPGSSPSGFNGIALGPDGAMWFTYRDSGGYKVGRLGY